MEPHSNVNPHCNIPHIVKDGVRWNIRFYFTVDGVKKAKKMADGLNDLEYLKKVNGKSVEYNKVERKVYANSLVAKYKARLKVDYFNPYTLEFETSDKSRLPFTKYLDDYLGYNPRKKRDESTLTIYKSYNNVIKAYLKEVGVPNISLKEINREFVERFLSTIEKKYSTRQRDHYLTHIKGVLKYCTDHLEVLSKQPIKTLHAINTASSKSNKAYPQELLEAVLNEARLLDVNFWLLLRMIYYTLRRPDELLKVQYKDFDFKKGTIDFDSDIIKTNKRMYSTLPDHLLNDLKGLIPIGVAPDDYLFGNMGKEGNSTRISKKLFGPLKTPLYHYQDRFKTIQKRLNLDKGYTIYSMKHTGVVYMVEVLKWSDKEIIAYTGHKDVKILETYSRDAKRERREHTGTI